jgi:3-oxoacyl-[acyl-carrier-protein] synthase III
VPTAVLAGLGAAVPPRVVTNRMLAGRLDTSDAWIFSRTGIRQRHVAGPGVTTGDLAVAAGGRALRAAGMAGHGTAVDMVVLATATPDRSCPATAPSVAARLGLGPVAAFDIAAVCTGFVYALTVAAATIGSGMARSVLVIGADTFTSMVDPTDRNTAVIFGDGAGAVVLRAGDDDEEGALLGFDLGSDGDEAELISVPAGHGAAGRLTMVGGAVFRHAVRHMTDSTLQVLDRVGWPVTSVGHLVGHQANIRILNTVATELDLPPDRMVANIDQVGNTSAASIPLALADAAAGSRFTPGERMVLTAFGGGLTWGSVALTWPGTPGLAPSAVRRPGGPAGRREPPVPSVGTTGSKPAPP